MSKKKKRRKEAFITLSLELKSPASMVQTVGYALMRSRHKAMVTDILWAFKVIVALVGTVLTIKKL
jgi:hypothetical protein